MPVTKNLSEYIKFFLIIAITIAVTYFTPNIISIIWYIILLLWYYRSDDEPLWLAVFLTTTDGFMSFMGLYTVTIPLLPGMPSVELIHFYIILTAVKASRIKAAPYCFFKSFLYVILIYVLFMIIWGQMMGFTEGLNGYFRLLKLTVPLLLFYSIPHLFTSPDLYERLFRFIFIILLTGFFTQVFTLLAGQSPAGFLNITAEQPSEKEDFRIFYNMAAVLIGLAGALFYITYRKRTSFNTIYLYIVIFSAFCMALLSATRGWIISFGIIIMLVLFIVRISFIRVLGFVIVIGALSVLGWSNATIREQILFSQERLVSLEPLTEGDITAGGTLKRLNVRGPRVMKVWKENRLFGWGFSDVSRRYSDGHVANQNLLMTSGIVGLIILISFIIYFSHKMVKRYFILKKNHPLKNSLLIFVIFLCGWIFIHSSSGQQFSYGGIPLLIAPQAVFFCFSALVYNETFNESI